MDFDRTTRTSLILSLRDRKDQQAWEEFVEIYQPMMEQLAKKLGMQASDIQDATQEVLVHLTRVVDQWNPDQSAGNVTFRGWLYRVARNVMVRYLQRRSAAEWAKGGSGFRHREPSDENTQTAESLIEHEFQQQIFFRVARKLKPQFRPSTWQAFWRTVVMVEPIDHVSRELGISKGAIYAARSRIMNRLRQEAQRIYEQEWMAEGDSLFLAAENPLTSRPTECEVEHE